MQTCPFCAARIQEAANFCPNCGRDLRDSTATRPTADQWFGTQPISHSDGPRSVLSGAVDDLIPAKGFRRRAALWLLACGVVGSYVVAYVEPVLLVPLMLVAGLGAILLFYRDDMRWSVLVPFFGAMVLVSPAIKRVESQRAEQARELQVHNAQAARDEAAHYFDYDLADYERRIDEVRALVERGEWRKAQPLFETLKKDLQQPLSESPLREQSVVC